MTPVELLHECKRRTDAGLTWIPLVLPPRKHPPRGERIRVLPGVLGELACVNASGELVVHVKIADVVRALERVMVPAAEAARR